VIISFRGRLFLATILLLIVTELAIGLHLENGLRTWINLNAEDELYRNAKGARELLVLADKPYNIKRMDSLADSFGGAIERRITIIDPKGRVLGDSELSGVALTKLENHGDRPEVKQAIKQQHGMARRYSATLNASMLYVATTYPHPDGLGVVRIQMSLADVEQIIDKIRLFLIIAALWGLGVLIVISGVATHLLTRTLRSLAKRVGRFANKDGPATDEISDLSLSFDRITQDLTSTLTSLSQERNRFETVLEGMVEAVFALDDKGRITLVNQAVAELLDEPDLILGRTLTEVIGGPEIETLVGSAIAGGGATKQFDLATSPKKIRLLARVSALKSGGCVAVLHDISDIHRLEEMRREFVANVSHELRTPVSVIMANAETLLEEGADDGANPHPLMEALHRNAHRLTDTISELLNLSRLDAGAYITDIQMLHLESEFANHVEAVRHVSQRTKPIKIEVSQDLQMAADQHALSRIISNLLSNAVKYTPSDSDIVVRASRQEDQIIIEVEDNGPGIAPQHHSLIFDRFHRAVNSRAQTVGGTGLGLAIVRSYLEVMNGSITLKSARPTGAIFKIILPAFPVGE
jgi:two-component system, OmpR family, phosphate regulon sensor histidine kinase PhoR